MLSCEVNGETAGLIGYVGKISYHLNRFGTRGISYEEAQGMSQVRVKASGRLRRRQ